MNPPQTVAVILHRGFKLSIVNDNTNIASEE